MKHFSNEFCEMELYDRFVIVTINENINLTLDKATIIRDQLRDHFHKSISFLMISHRKHKLNVHPDVYKQGQLPNMRGLAIVSSDHKQKEQAAIEQQLYGKSFVFFTRIEEAKAWAEGYF